MKFSCEPRFSALLAMLVLAADAHARRGVIAGDAMSDLGVSNQSAAETMHPDVEELPGEVRHQLAKQEAAMTSVHLSFEQRSLIGPFLRRLGEPITGLSARFSSMGSGCTGQRKA